MCTIYVAIDYVLDSRNVRIVTTHIKLSEAKDALLFRTHWSDMNTNRIEWEPIYIGEEIVEWYIKDNHHLGKIVVTTLGSKY